MRSAVGTKPPLTPGERLLERRATTGLLLWQVTNRWQAAQRADHAAVIAMMTSQVLRSLADRAVTAVEACDLGFLEAAP